MDSSLYRTNETAKETSAATANMIAYCTGWARHSRIPKIPVTPVPEAASEVSALTGGIPTVHYGYLTSGVEATNMLLNTLDGVEGESGLKTLKLGHQLMNVRSWACLSASEPLCLSQNYHSPAFSYRSPYYETIADI